MRKVVFSLLIVFVFSFNGFAYYINDNCWIEYEVLPFWVRDFDPIMYSAYDYADINNKGALIGKNNAVSAFRAVVYRDPSISAEDADYCYVTFMQDHGWIHDGREWIGTELAISRKLGYMYINPVKRVAIYFYPQNVYGVFKVRFENILGLGPEF